MSITDELRTGGIYRFPSNRRVFTEEELTAIADRIDAEHYAACAEAYGNGVQSVALPDMTAYAKLPVDAEGEPINVGDVMEWPDCSTAEVVGIGNDTFFYVEEGDDAAEWSCASDKIHRHIPTVEEVLREFYVLAVRGKEAHAEDVDADVLTEYAAKLRLVGDE